MTGGAAVVAAAVLGARSFLAAAEDAEPSSSSPLPPLPGPGEDGLGAHSSGSGAAGKSMDGASKSMDGSIAKESATATVMVSSSGEETFERK